jgi:bifunctional UDP-N-acetylglucosamine pyrophosphorylase/glucosamine-1-phosphate N-acetyltransferase
MDFCELAQWGEQERAALLARHRAAGVRIPCADGVVVAPGVRIGAGTLLLPGTMLLGQSEIGENCVLGPNTVLQDTRVAQSCELNSVQGEGAVIGEGCRIGPFVRLRPGTRLGRGLRIGNFVELKNAEIGDGTRIAHLSYIGDATFGKEVNVGCGLAVANYDGRQKHRTVVGDRAFLGCHNALVAPVAVGEGAYTAAGSTITEDVPPGALAIARARQVNKK